MPNLSFNVPFNDSSYTFEPEFIESLPVYQGLIALHIGDGTSETITETVIEGHVVYTGGIGGYLYGKYHNGTWQSIGFVSDYEEAKVYIHDSSGNPISYADWVQLLAATPTNAVTAGEQANRAAVWASGSSQGNGSATNNSKYWSQQSQSHATDASTSAGNAASSATAASNSAQTAGTKAQDSEAWAVGKRNGSDVPSSDQTYQNNAKFYANQANTKAQDASNYATAAGNKATEASGYASNASASANAASGSASDASTYASNAQTSAGNALVSAQNAANSATLASEKAEAVKHAVITVSYQNSASGTVVPSGGEWDDSPSPVKGEYLWIKILFTWPDNTTSTLYNVTYIGVDGDNIPSISNADIDSLFE